MKIGIITYFYYYNYGTMLQGYATQRLFEHITQNSNVEIIDCRFGEKKENTFQLLKIRLRRIHIYLTQLNRIYKLYKYKNKLSIRKQFFDNFVEEECKMSTKTYVYSSELNETPPIYDIYITGSDQTWSPKIGLRGSLFLDFVKGDAVKASYAPSIGVTSYDNEQLAFVKEHLESYNFVSCREKYGALILNDISPVKVETVLDPTLMISSNEWSKLASSPKIEGKYILCYFLGDRYYYRNFANQLSKQLNLPLYYIPVSYVDFSDGNNMMWESGPKEFLGLIKNAEIVLTDSFHGTLFSINFNITFYSFIKHAGLDSMDNMRIVDILDRLQLLNRLVSEYEGGIIKYEEIDYKNTNKLLDLERENSKKYVEKIIQSAK